MDYSCIVLAAGTGSRTGLEYNKVFIELDGSMIIEKSLEHFINDVQCKEIIIVINKKEEAFYDEIKQINKISLAYGGNSRSESVINGLNKVTSKYVMIHDGARPFLKMESINVIKECLKGYNACVLMTEAIDTIKIVEDGFVKVTPSRSNVFHAQTPQAFKTSLIKECYNRYKQDDIEITDDAQVVEIYSDEKIKVVLGNQGNYKVTTKKDVEKIQ